MKQLTLDSKNPISKHERFFEIIYTAATTPHYRFEGREELRAHGKLLDALEEISLPNGTVEGTSQLKRKLKPGEQLLVLDDAWLNLLMKMGAAAPWVATTTRDVVATLDFLDTAQEYKAEGKKK